MPSYGRAGTDIRAWTFEAAIHCVPCTRARFGKGVTDYPWPDTMAVDSEGNQPHPVFVSDECPEDYTEVCGTCNEVID